jgi:flagellar basal body L-ring protein FlgH
MLRNITKTVGSTMAALCLVSTLAMAQAQQPPSQSQQPQTQTQSPSQPMTPQHGNTTPQQGHRQNPPESQPMMKMTCFALMESSEVRVRQVSYSRLYEP